MKSNKEQYNLDCKLIILLNKCDELEKDNITQEYLPSDTELLGMVKQVKNIVETNKKEIFIQYQQFKQEINKKIQRSNGLVEGVGELLE